LSSTNAYRISLFLVSGSDRSGVPSSQEISFAWYFSFALLSPSRNAWSPPVRTLWQTSRSPSGSMTIRLPAWGESTSRAVLRSLALTQWNSE
jgi:hypothetical protein